MGNNQQRKMAKPHMHILMTQMSIKQGIKAFGKRGNDALLKELNQPHEQKALLPLRKEDISYEQRKSTTLSNYPERKTRWHNQSQWLCRWEITVRIHSKIRH